MTRFVFISLLAAAAAIFAAAYPALAETDEPAGPAETPTEIALNTGPEWSVDEDPTCAEISGFPSVGPGNPFFWEPVHIAMEECGPPQDHLEGSGSIALIIKN